MFSPQLTGKTEVPESSLKKEKWVHVPSVAMVQTKVKPILFSGECYMGMGMLHERCSKTSDAIVFLSLQ